MAHYIALPIPLWCNPAQGAGPFRFPPRRLCPAGPHNINYGNTMILYRFSVFFLKNVIMGWI